MNTKVYTVGHSTNNIEQFIKLLKQHAITAIADVRSQPYSKFNPQFNREPLEKSLKEDCIKYVFLGKELGARSEEECCYKDGKVQYDRIAETSLFKEGITRVIEGSKTYKIALMCSEKEPLDCHRTILVSKELQKHAVEIIHILENGSIESHNQTEERLLELVNSDNLTFDLFINDQEKLIQAYKIRESDIAYSANEGILSA